MELKWRMGTTTRQLKEPTEAFVNLIPLRKCVEPFSLQPLPWDVRKRPLQRHQDRPGGSPARLSSLHDFLMLTSILEYRK